MINPICEKCGCELKDFGAILLSPPDAFGRVVKYHICKKCFFDFEDLIAAKPAKEEYDSSEQRIITRDEFEIWSTCECECGKLETDLFYALPKVVINK